MDCTRLRVSIPKVSIATNDGVVHKYCIKLVYGKLGWEVHHRFSEFHSLNDTLHSMCQFQALPPPPSKSLLRPHDSAVLEERRIMLQNWIRLLCARPDVRTSSPFLEFIEFERYTNVTVHPLAPVLCGVCEDGKFQLSDCVWREATRSVIASYEETASMARVGKVWSLVETEELGSLSIWGIRVPDGVLPDASLYGLHSSVGAGRPVFGASNAAAVPLDDFREIQFDKTVHMAAPHRFRCIYFFPVQNRLFVGLDTGVVEVYNVPFSPSEYTDEVPTVLHGFMKETELPLHTESLLSLRGNEVGPGRFITTGFDKAVRVVNCTTLETISGGNLAKRLEYREHLATAVLEGGTDEESFLKSRMFIGTSKGNVFVYSSQTNPPEYRTTISCKEPIGALELAGANLLIAHKYTLSIYRVGRPGDETKAFLTAQFRPDLHSGRTISSIAVSVSVPLLFLGHSRAITVWDCHDKVCVAAFKAHYNGVRRLCLLGSTSQIRPSPSSCASNENIMLLSAGGDGYIKLWEFSSPSEYRYQLATHDDSPHGNLASTPPENVRHSSSVPTSADQLPINGQEQSAGQFPGASGDLSNLICGGIKTTLENGSCKHSLVTSCSNAVEDDDEDGCLIPADFTAAIPHRH